MDLLLRKLNNQIDALMKRSQTIRAVQDISRILNLLVSFGVSLDQVRAKMAQIDEIGQKDSSQGITTENMNFTETADRMAVNKAVFSKTPKLFCTYGENKIPSGLSQKELRKSMSTIHL